MTSHATTAGLRRTLATGMAGAGLLLLTGCAMESANADNSSTPTGSGSTQTSASSYSDGVYTVDADYVAPSGVETVSVSITLTDDVVTAVSVTGDAVDHEAREFQERFAGGIASEVVGRDIADLSVSRVSGASLTSNGFNAALDEVRSEALA